MKDEIEFEVWRSVQQECGASAFVRIVEEAVGSFKRDPGYDPIVRLHASGIGAEGIRVLRNVLNVVISMHAYRQVMSSSGLV